MRGTDDEGLNLPANRDFGVVAADVLYPLSDFWKLADVPPEAEWFGNIQNQNTRRAYRNDVEEFIAFAGIKRPESFANHHSGSRHRVLICQPNCSLFLTRRIPASKSMSLTSRWHSSPAAARQHEGQEDRELPVVALVQELFFLLGRQEHDRPRIFHRHAVHFDHDEGIFSVGRQMPPLGGVTEQGAGSIPG